MTTNLRPSRGEVWNVRFTPSIGAEIRKLRPAIVLSLDSAGRLPLRIVVPVTDWKPVYTGYFWMIHLPPEPANGLNKDSGADAFQVKSISESRFLSKLGDVTPPQLERIAEAIALCVGAF